MTNTARTGFLLLLLSMAAIGARAQAPSEQGLYREAEDDYRTGNTLLALERYQDFARTYPLSDRMPDAQYRIGVCQYRLGRYGEAVETFRRVESRYATTRYFELVPFWAGMAFYHLGRWGDAVAAFERFEGRLADPDTNSQALLYRGLSEVELGDLAAASRSMERLASSYPASPLRPQALLRLMELRLRGGDAAGVLTVDVAELPTEWQAQGRLYRAEALWRLGRKEEARPLYESLRREPPAFAALAYQRLFALAQSAGDLSGMESLAQEAESSLAGRPGVLEDLWLRVGAESLQRNDLESAGYFLRRAWERGPGAAAAGTPSSQPALSLYLAEVSIRQGRLDDAAAVLSLPVAGKDPAVTLRLADVRLMQGRFADAAPLYERAAQSASTAEAAEASALLAYCRYRLGDRAGALAITTRLLGAKAGGPVEEAQRREVLRLHAAILAAQGSLDAATSALTELVASAPTDGRASLDLLRLLFRRGEYAEIVRRAGQGAAQAVAQAPGGAAPVAGAARAPGGSAPAAGAAVRGGAAPAAGAAAPATAGAARAPGGSAPAAGGAAPATAGASSPPAPPSEAYVRVVTLYLKGLSEVALKRHAEALATLEPLTPALTAAAGLSVIDPYVLYYKAWSLYRRGDLAKARDQLFALIDAYPSHALRQEALYLAGWCLYNLSDHRRALAFFKEVSEGTGPRAERATLLYGKSLAELGRTAEALAAFQALGRNPGEFADDARFEAAAVLATLGRVDDAAAAYRDLASAFPSSPLAEEALYRRGVLYREARRSAEAAAAFTDYRTRFSSGAQMDGALYWGGLSSLESGQPFAAVLLWEILIDRYRGSPYRVDALKRTAAIYADRGESGRALALLERLAADYPGEAAGVGDRLRELRLVVAGVSDREASLTVRVDREGGVRTTAGRAAMLELAALYVHGRAGKLDDADRLIGSLLGSGDAAVAARSHYLLAELRDLKGAPVEAAREFVAAAAAAPGDADLAPSALYRAAEALSRAGKRDDTRALVQRLESAFPGSSWTLEARKLLEVSR